MTVTWSRLEGGRHDQLERALNDSNAGGVYVQQVVSRRVAHLTNRSLGVWTALDHRPGSGDAYLATRRSAGTTGGSWVADTGTPTEETGSAARATITYRTAVTRGQVTRFLQAAGRGWGDVFGTELDGKSQDFSNLLETAGVQGDNNANSNQPDGLLTLIAATGAQVISQGSNTAGNTLTEEKLQETIDQCRGPDTDKLIVCSRKGSRKLNALLAGRQRFDMVEIRAGFRVQSYDGIPIVKSTQVPDTLTHADDGDGTGTIAAFTGGTSTAIIVVNRNEIFWSELTPVSVLPLARSTSQNEQFDLFWDGCIAMDNTLGGSILAGITTA